jgi:hypothetical protein
MGEILHLTLMRKWFLEILEGKKKIEYREIKPYWTKRLFADGKQKKYDYIIFKNGYSKNAPEMKVEFLGVKIKEKYEIILGKVLEKKNCDLFFC